MTESVSTSDGIHRPNGMTREQWLHAVLYSGRVSRIGQHLALVIYHLADTATNIAKLSARDLERVTGWSKTVIVKHLNELHDLGEFLNVTWGQGRAKSIFEMQGVIAEVMAAKKAERDAATADANEVAATPSGSEPATTVAGTVSSTVATNSSGNQGASEDAKNVCGNVQDHSCGNVAATKSKKTAEGGTIGGETTLKVESHSHTLSAREREKSAAPDWMVSEDGGFEGQVFELTGIETGALQTTYGYLDFPADLVAVDQFLARQFDRTGVRPNTKECLARMHTYLAKRNREAREVGLRMGLIDKPQRKPAEPVAPTEPPSCWFDDDARLQVANGFKVELLETVGGEEIKLREALDEAAGWVGVQVRGPQLIAKVRSQITKQVKGRTATAAKSTPASKRERIAQWAREEEDRLKAEKSKWSARQ